MKKISLSLIGLFVSLYINACDCDIINPAIEFYESDYVFKGFVSSKEYSEDSLSYTIKFNILKHFKKSNTKKLPNELSFVLKAESKYTGVWSSCDWSVCRNQTWLVYAQENNSGELMFSGICSNSRTLNNFPITERQEAALEEANNFKLNDYVYFYEPGFNYTRPISDLDSIISNGQSRNYSKSFAWLKLYIDEEGNLIDIISPKNLKQIRDNKFNLTKEIINTYKEPLSQFEKDAIELLLNVKKWGIKKHKKTNAPVKYVMHISIGYDMVKKKWHYEF